MSEWKTYKLGDISEDISYGYTESATYEKIGPKFLRITDIQNYFIEWKNVPFCAINKKNYEKYKLNVGDIVIARTGATTGVTSIFKNDKIDAVFASYLIRFKIDKNLADPFYIGYIVKSPLWNKYIDSIIGGSAQPGANAKQFAEFEFFLPDLNLQSQITSILTTLDDKIELNLQINQTLESMAQVIFKEWFVNFNFPGFDGKLVDGLPKGWRMGEIEDLFILQRGYDLPTEQRIEGEYPVVAASGISSFHNEFKVKGPSVTTGRSGVLGKVYYISEHFWPLNTSLFIKNYKNSTPLYAYHVLKNMNLLQLNSGSAVPTLNRNEVHSINCFVPDMKIIRSYENIVFSLFEKISKNIKQNKTLTQIRDNLLPRLMSGKIKMGE